MSEEVMLAMEQAKSKYGTISPCVGANGIKTWDECVDGGYLWFNTVDHSTHIQKIN